MNINFETRVKVGFLKYFLVVYFYLFDDRNFRIFQNILISNIFKETIRKHSQYIDT